MTFKIFANKMLFSGKIINLRNLDGGRFLSKIEIEFQPNSNSINVIEVNSLTSWYCKFKLFPRVTS